MEPDEDGVVRHQYLYKTGIISGQEDTLLSFDLVTARKLEDANVEIDTPTGHMTFKGRSIPHDDDYGIPINWVGPPGTFRNSYSFAELMRRFYRHIADGSSTDEALRSAQLELASKPIHLGDGGILDASHPYFWAAFQISGDWQ